MAKSKHDPFFSRSLEHPSIARSFLVKQGYIKWTLIINCLIPSNHPNLLMAKKMHKDHTMSIEDICRTLKISGASFYRYLSL